MAGRPRRLGPSRIKPTGFWLLVSFSSDSRPLLRRAVLTVLKLSVPAAPLAPSSFKFQEKRLGGPKEAGEHVPRQYPSFESLVISNFGI